GSPLLLGGSSVISSLIWSRGGIRRVSTCWCRRLKFARSSEGTSELLTGELTTGASLMMGVLALTLLNSALPFSHSELRGRAAIGRFVSSSSAQYSRSL